MRVLALDSTTRSGSVAFVDDNGNVDERAGDPVRSHAERYPADLVALLREHDTTLAAIDLFAVAAGPGSFTGLRVGIATMQGLAFVRRRRIVPIGALEALAHAAADGLPPGATIATWMDAQRRDVFAARFEVTTAPRFTPEHVRAIDAATVDAPLEVAVRFGRSDAWVGDGAARFADLIRDIDSNACIMATPLLAGAIARIAWTVGRDSECAVDPGGVQPIYVRRPDAEIERERRSR
jgi:tRNA threonylcarbamoyladenosine biosynthesis protein TsaB